MDYSWGAIPVGLFLLTTGYLLRRHTVRKQSRYRIFLIIDGMWIGLYILAFFRDMNSFHVFILVALIVSLSVASLLLYRYDQQLKE